MDPRSARKDSCRGGKYVYMGPVHDHPRDAVRVFISQDVMITTITSCEGLALHQSMRLGPLRRRLTTTTQVTKRATVTCMILAKSPIMALAKTPLAVTNRMSQMIPVSMTVG